MRHRRDPTHPSEAASHRSSANAQGEIPKRRKRLRRWFRFGLVLLVLILLVGVGRALVPWAVRDYVNRTLDRNPLYAGNIGEVHIESTRPLIVTQR